MDFLITGKNAAQQPCLIIVELKQWTQAGKTPLDAVVTTHSNLRLCGVRHKLSHVKSNNQAMNFLRRKQ